MTVIFVLILFSMLVAGTFLAGCIWAIKSGQFEDPYTPSVRILLEDNISRKLPKQEITKNSK